MISLVRGLFHLSSRRSTAKSVITRAHAGATKFNKKEKKAFEERRVTTLGGHAEKNEKMPFKMLLAVRAANKAREAKHAEQARRARALARESLQTTCETFPLSPSALAARLRHHAAQVAEEAQRQERWWWRRLVLTAAWAHDGRCDARQGTTPTGHCGSCREAPEAPIV